MSSPPFDPSSVHQEFPSVAQTDPLTRNRLVVELTIFDQLVPLLDGIGIPRLQIDLVLTDYIQYQILVKRLPSVSFDPSSIKDYMSFLKLIPPYKTDIHKNIIHTLFIGSKALEYKAQKKPINKDEVNKQFEEFYNYNGFTETSQVDQEINSSIDEPMTSNQNTVIESEQSPQKISQPLNANDNIDDTIDDNSDNEYVDASQQEENIPAAQPKPQEELSQSNDLEGSPEDDDDNNNEEPLNTALSLYKATQDEEQSQQEPRENPQFWANVHASIEMCAAKIDEFSNDLKLVTNSIDLDIPLLRDLITEETDNRKESISIFANFFDRKIDRIMKSIDEFKRFIQFSTKTEYDILTLKTNFEKILDSLRHNDEEIENISNESKAFHSKVIDSCNDAHTKIIVSQNSLKDNHTKSNKKISTLLTHINKLEASDQNGKSQIETLKRTVGSLESNIGVLKGEHLKLSESFLSNQFDMETILANNGKVLSILNTERELNSKVYATTDKFSAMQNEMNILKSQVIQLKKEKDNKDNIIAHILGRLNELEFQNIKTVNSSTLSKPSIPTSSNQKTLNQNHTSSKPNSPERKSTSSKSLNKFPISTKLKSIPLIVLDPNDETPSSSSLKRAALPDTPVELKKIKLINNTSDLNSTKTPTRLKESVIENVNHSPKKSEPSFLQKIIGSTKSNPKTNTSPR